MHSHCFMGRWTFLLVKNLLNGDLLSFQQVEQKVFGVPKSSQLWKPESKVFPEIENFSWLTLFVDVFERDCELTASATIAPSCFFDLVSDAFNSITS
jgi:hypothetical protein